MTRKGMLLRLVAAGVAIIAITDYGFRTVQKTTEAESRVTSLQIRLDRTRRKLASAKRNTVELQAQIDELTKELASRSEIERQLRRNMLGIKDKPEPPDKVPDKSPDKPAAKPPAGKADRGLITAILYGVENSSVVVDNEIVSEGDTIYGVKVVRIHKDQVEFTKDSTTWIQKIHQPPPAWWGQNKL